MSKLRMWTQPTGDETEEACPCCGRPLFDGQGVLMSENGELAEYAYRWAEGHGKRFMLAVCPMNERGEFHVGLAALTCRSDGESLIYNVLEPTESPWGDTEVMGKVLTRQQLLQDCMIPDLFDLVDAIAAREERISSRILAP